MKSRIENWQVDGFLPYMRDVVRCDESLRELNLTWRMIEASAKVNCAQEARGILPMMSATREGFERLEQELVTCLVQERVDTVLQSVGTRARHVVDIVVRNLFERTADVGFLATDRDLCDYLAGAAHDRAYITARLRAYRDKYTVYDDILLLDTQGEVMAQIDDARPVPRSGDELVARTLASDAYVETCRPSDLRPGRRNALIYSRRMHDASGRVVGLLCLSFNFDDEMAGIFRSRRDREERSVMLLLDGDNAVMASSDELWIPVGTRVPTHHDGAPQLLVFSGREYLVQSYLPQGYQGYPGPRGWQGQVMIPVDVAFTGRRDEALRHLDPEVSQGLLTHARQFCPPLFSIVTAAQAIRRVVWNGQVMTASHGDGQDLSKLKAVLDQVSEAGARTDALFTRSIHDLYDTVLSATLRRAEFVTRLQVDLLDRNLYERSDDCRWWALAPELRRGLAHAGQPGAPDAGALSTLLEAINALYTVYTRLVVYDAQGRIVAATQPEQPDGSSVLGQGIEVDTLQAVMALPHAQAYHVTPFRATPLYGERPTYVYHAAIRHPEDERRVVGGIGIVFDAEPEFKAMLGDALHGRGVGCTAVFTDRSGRVLASVDPALPVGSTLALPAEMAALAAGAVASRIVEHRGQYAVMACSASCGYREFKVSDGYREDVIAVMFEPLGAVNATARPRQTGLLGDTALGSDTTHGLQFATFFLDGQLHALPAAQVREALPGAEIAPVAAGRSAHRLGMIALREKGQAERYAWVYDLLGLLRREPTAHPEECQVVIARFDGQELGLLVNSLHAVPEFLPEQVVNIDGQTPSGGMVRQMISTNQGQTLIPVLDIAALVGHLRGAEAGSDPFVQELLAGMQDAVLSGVASGLAGLPALDEVPV